LTLAEKVGGVDVAARARDLVAFAREQGYQPEELVTIIQGLR
jgi:hypothetical protein